MILSKTKKIIIVLCIVSLSTITLQPKPAEAFFPDWLNAAIQVIGHGIQGGLLGVDSAANTFQAGLESINRFLDGLPIEYGPARKALSAATAGCEIVGGNFFAAQTLVDIAGSSSSSSDGPAPHEAGSEGHTTSTTGNTTTNSTSTSVHEAGHVITPTITTTGTDASSHEAGNVSSHSTSNSVSELAGSLAEVGDQTKANLTLVLGQKLGLLKHRQTCYKILNQSLQAAMLIGGWNDQLKQAFADTITELNTKSNPINSQINDLTKQQIAAKQDVFKAIAASVALQTTEANTMATVDELKPKLTMGSYGKVSEALAKRVYAVEMIKKNYDNDKNKQLIMTNLLDSELAPDKAGKDQAIRSAQALVEAEVRSNCKQDYQLTDYTQETFNEIPTLVDPNCDVTRVFDGYKSEFNQLMATSKESASHEVSTSQGFVSPRPCVDKSDKEKSVATTSAEAAKKLAQILSKRSQIQRSPVATTAELIDAINEERKAIAEIKTLPVVLDGGIVVSCGPIKDSGSLIKSQFDNYINQWMTQGIQGSKTENFPLLAEFVKTIPEKLFGGLLLKKGEKNSVFTEIGATFLNAVLTGAFKSGSSSTKGTQVNISPDQIPVHNTDSAGHSTTPNGSGVSSNSNSNSLPNGTVNTPLSTTPTVNGASTTVPSVPYFSPRSSSVLGAY